MIRYLKSLFAAKKPQSDVVNASNNTYGITFGEGSYILSPNKISGGKYISIGKNTVIGHSVWLSAFDTYSDQRFEPKIVIGDNVSIGNYACITGVNSLVIEDGCLFSEHLYISDHYHGTDPSSGIRPLLQPLFTKGEVRIGENTFVGYRVSILSGTSIGKNCVVGAHSVVTKSVPDNCMVAGVPARIIKKFNFETKNWEEYQ